MTGFDYFKMAFRKYAEFEGRSRRREYWFFALFYVLIAIAVGILSAILDWAFVLYIALTLVFIIPSLAVTVRRLHDIGKSGWFYFISLIPLVGSIILIVWMCTDSQPGSNQWGPNPKEEGDDVADHLITEEDLV